MKRRVCLAGCLAVVLTHWGMVAAQADADAFRFSSIPERNVFGLRAMTKFIESTPPPVVPPAPLAAIELTGVVSMPFLGALLEIIPGPGKPMIKPVLREGEKLDSIELVSIDVDKGQVVIINSGIVTNVPLKVAKASTSTGPTVANRPGVTLTGGSSMMNPASPYSGDSGARIIPSRNRRAGLPGIQPGGLSPEAAVIDLEHSRQSNPASFPPLPPTPLTPHLTTPVPHP